MSSVMVKEAQPISTPLLSRLGWLLFFMAVGWLLYRGWLLRGEHYLTAEKGVGYLLGIIGGSLMLALLLYPLRKNLRLMRRWGSVSIWFRMHMLFGVLGPALILFHSNFILGSLNSTVALLCMLLVAASGLIGRFIYTRIHYGLYGSKATLQELGEIATSSKGRLEWLCGRDEEFQQRLRQVELLAMEPVNGIWHSLARWLKYTLSAWWIRWHLGRLTTQALRRAGHLAKWDSKTQRRQRREARAYLKRYFQTARKVLEFNFYERMFALWHVVHLPFFFMMLLSGVIHVIAVHMY